MNWFTRHWHLLAAVICVIAAGAFRGAEDIRLFHSEENVFYEHLVLHGQPADADWYYGGVDRYNASTPWTADFWHRMKHFEYICWGLALAFASRTWWMFFLYPVFNFSFVLNYHYFWRMDPDGSLLEVIAWILGAGLFAGARMRKKKESRNGN